MKDFDLKVRVVRKFKWMELKVSLGQSDLLIKVADPNILGLRLWDHCRSGSMWSNSGTVEVEGTWWF